MTTTTNMTRNGWNLRREGTRSEAWLMDYSKDASRGEFVARFKRTTRDLPAFVKFLTAHFTPAEYQSLLAAGMTPVKALESKGFVNERVEKGMRDNAAFLNALSDAELASRGFRSRDVFRAAYAKYL